MPSLSLSPEISKRIVEFAAHRQHDLLSLCRTCKALQREAEVKIYGTVILSEPRQTLSACDTIARNERLAQHIRTFMYNQELRQSRETEIILGREFWTAIQRALISAINLDCLLLSDGTCSNSWILDTPNIRFHLRELRVRLTWDGPLVRFLETQHTLRNLHFYDSAEEITHHIQPQCLPELRLFEGTLMVGMQLVPSNLVHVQLIVDCEPPPNPNDVFPRFGGLRKTLRGLSLLELPDNISQQTMDIISRVLPDLRHLGLFSYPMMERREFHQCLMRMRCLHTLELDLGRWNPQPMMTAAQRIIAAELQTFCPTLRVVIFWLGTMRCKWTHNPQTFWQSHISMRQYPQNSSLWCMS